jgi:integrase
MPLREERDPLSAFTYALKAPETSRQYPRRLKVFFDFMQFDSPLEEQAKQFLIKARSDPQWAQDSLMAFILY